MIRLSTLFRFLRGLSKSKPEILDVVHFWEDDYCQIELIPRENKKFVENEIEAFYTFSKKHLTDQGYTAMYQRDNNPFSTCSNEIIFSVFGRLLIDSGLPLVKTIYYEGELSSTTQIKAFGNSKFAICVDVENGFADNIWIISRFKMTAEQLLIAQNTLYQIGETYDLILIDWNSLDLVDLQNKIQIMDYLSD